MPQPTLNELLKNSGLPSLKQPYDEYSDEDFDVWKLLFERQYAALPHVASKAYLEGLEKIGFSAERIADFEDANKRLAGLTGWAIHVVPGLVDDNVFFGLLSHRRFPSSTWLRSMKELDYFQEPDMFHDAFAHLPLLTNQPYVDFLENLASIALDYLDNPLAVEFLSRIYWYTIEFGLIRESGKLKVYGAGILSSSGETKFCLSEEPKHLAFDVKTVMNTPFWKNRFQDKYFIIERYEQLYEAIPEIRSLLEAELAKSTD